MDADSCYRAMTARDARFDGVFFVGVETTGIYCRPVCSARTPRRDRCEFFASAAAAERAGFRACFRCRPELAPGAAPIDALPRLVARAVAKIDEGYLNEATVDDLARDLGVAGRHLRRAVHAVLGVSPAELAQTRRLALAKQLLHDCDLGLADVAFAAGFGSVRRFNAAFKETFGGPPSKIRRGSSPGRGLHLRLGYRAPFDFARVLRFLAARAIPGIEEVTEDSYARDGVVVRDDPRRACLDVELNISPARASGAMRIAARLRALFDLDARPDAIASVLQRDRTLAKCVRARPGLRVPGAYDAFEVAVRAILGQQVSVRAATTLSSRLAAAIAIAPENLADSIPPIGIPATRAHALRSLAQAVHARTISLEHGADPASLERLPGIGPWTAQYIAMRAFADPDAFPAADLVLRKALGGLTPAKTLARAEAWRPWRAYAVLHLWTASSEGDLP